MNLESLLDINKMYLEKTYTYIQFTLSLKSKRPTKFLQNKPLDFSHLLLLYICAKDVYSEYVKKEVYYKINY